MSSKLKLYNTLTNKKEEFKAINPSHITMYVCGPTVYDFAHVGNARPVVVFDTLARLLRHDYGKVTYARNITDIDDKIIAAATNGNIAEITEKFARHYEEDMSALNAKKPDIVPKATDYLDEMIVLISDLIAKGYAYEASEHVLFQVSKMDDYGELSGRKVEDLLAGARVDIAGYKREASDFVLWKPSSDAQPGWESPWGRGRPGWHTECSAMIKKNFGETIDIHGGGQDLIFPHHENEIAQSKSAHGGRNLANYWLHNGYLTVSGEKMSKSRGTFINARSYLEHIKDPNFLRYYYATKLNSSMEDLDLNLDDFVAKNNSDLIGKFINIPSRTSGFVGKFFNHALMPLTSIKSEEGLMILKKIKDAKQTVDQHYEAREFSKLVKFIMQLIEELNEYISKTEPWKLAKEDQQLKSDSSLHEICSVCLKSFRSLSIYLTPIIPNLCEKIAAFYDEEIFNSFNLIQDDALKIKSYKHLLKRIEQDSIDAMVNSNRAVE